MDIFQAIILGIVQGIAEFLPISSSAHLRIVQAFLGWPDTGAAVTAIMQLGTLFTVLIFFRRDLTNISQEFFKGLRSGRPFNSQHARLAWFLGLGTIPLALCGLLFKDFIKSEARSLWIIAGSLIILSLILAIAEATAARRKELGDVGWGEGMAVGAAQALALIPGSSRSGTTLTAALFAGMTREAAARYSFLLSVPAVSLSGIYSLWEIRHELSTINMPAVLVATGVSFVVGYASIALLMRYLRTHSTHIFIAYRIILGIILIALLWAGMLKSH